MKPSEPNDQEPSTMTRLRILTLLVMLAGGFSLAAMPSRVLAVGPASAAGTSIAKALGKYIGKQGGEEATQFLSRQGSKEMLERVARNAAEEGGDAAVAQIARLAGRHGPQAISALDNAPASIMPLIRALDELPESQVQSALARLAAGKSGRELATEASRYGSAALRSELKHPGVGTTLVRELGEDGIEMASRLTSNQAMVVARHADEIARLPAAQRTGVLALLRRDSEAMVGFMGRFIQQNPGKTLFTVATTTVLLAEPERFFGGDVITLDADGNPVVVSRPGIVGRTMEAGGAAAAHASQQYLRPLYITGLVFLGTFTALWMIIKLWHLVHLRKV